MSTTQEPEQLPYSRSVVLLDSPSRARRHPAHPEDESPLLPSRQITSIFHVAPLIVVGHRWIQAVTDPSGEAVVLGATAPGALVEPHQPPSLRLENEDSGILQ